MTTEAILTREEAANEIAALIEADTHLFVSLHRNVGIDVDHLFEGWTAYLDGGIDHVFRVPDPNHDDIPLTFWAISNVVSPTSVLLVAPLDSGLTEAFDAYVASKDGQRSEDEFFVFVPDEARTEYEFAHCLVEALEIADPDVLADLLDGAVPA